jgi:putative phage-type endonuclease
VRDEMKSKELSASSGAARAAAALTIEPESAARSLDRRRFIGGSDIGPILGVSRWKTALDLFDEKTAEIPLPDTIDPERARRLKRGKRLEPVICEMLEEEFHIFASRRDLHFTDPEFPFFRFQLDYEAETDAGLVNVEIKTVSPWAAKEWGEEQTDEVPLHYLAQVMWGLGITKRNTAVVAALVGSDDLRMHLVERDDDLIAEMRRRALIFWIEHVEKRVAPPPQTIDDANRLLMRYGAGFELPATPETVEAIRVLRRYRDEISQLKKLAEKCELDIKWACVTGAEANGRRDAKQIVVTDDNRKKIATLTMQHRDEYTVKASDFPVLRLA